MTGARGTPGYAAPELWLPLPVTHKCDVYSFGMLVFEILGRRRNYLEAFNKAKRKTQNQDYMLCSNRSLITLFVSCFALWITMAISSGEKKTMQYLLLASSSNSECLRFHFFSHFPISLIQQVPAP
jgi:serine/threonine protein kinase